MIREHDRVVLTDDLPKDGLKAGDAGTVVPVHAAGKAFEVEFVTLNRFGHANQEGLRRPGNSHYGCSRPALSGRASRSLQGTQPNHTATERRGYSDPPSCELLLSLKGH